MNRLPRLGAFSAVSPSQNPLHLLFPTRGLREPGFQGHPDPSPPGGPSGN